MSRSATSEMLGSPEGYLKGEQMGFKHASTIWWLDGGKVACLENHPIFLERLLVVKLPEVCDHMYQTFTSRENCWLSICFIALAICSKVYMLENIFLYMHICTYLLLSQLREISYHHSSKSATKPPVPRLNPSNIVRQPISAFPHPAPSPTCRWVTRERWEYRST
ncbi:hypothetical protein AAMO2058_000456100 [Amorphochlora amoebiformis]